MLAETDSFYSDLPAFSDFSTVGDMSLYAPAPDNWVVLAADIVRSRDAIANGRYKDVNLIGAAVISAVLNRIGRDRVPFVFGGDGATLLVSSNAAGDARQALAGVQKLAREETGLTLRIAAIPLAHIRGEGGDVRLRKYELSPGNHLAMAVGGGLELADRILKNEELCRPFRIEDPDAPRPDLEGLSCRWEPLPSERGRILSLILKPVEPGGGELQAIRQDIRRIVGFDPFGDAEGSTHVTLGRLRFRFPPRGLGLEIRMLAKAGQRLSYGARAVAECLAFIAGSTTGLRIGPFRPKRYLQEICRNTDHRKLDDSLRLVLDIAPSQLEELKRYLEEAFHAGRLLYGLHESGSALMTCFMSDMEASQHVHFIDGADGGLSVAASDFKKRQATAVS